MVRILRGEFTKSRKPSDLVEEQEGYGECFSKCKLRRNRAVGFEPIGVVGSLMKSHFSVSGVGELKSLPPDSRGCERQSPEGAKGFAWANYW
jgi:hypothetical protein